MNVFEGRSLVIATMHQKEKAIAPILEESLMVHCFLPNEFNTDLLGTFSGEIERTLDSISTARNKCLQAMELTGCDLGLASEGSFGPHPNYFFLPANEELLILIDKKNELEIISRIISTKTNFASKVIQSKKELNEFLEAVNFPSHAVILSAFPSKFVELHKGIQNEIEVIETFEKLILKYGKVTIETDMRAMYNPMRMDVIKEASVELVKKLNALCPQCEMPGFSISQVKRGLLCSICGNPTKMPLYSIYSCSKCDYEEIQNVNDLNILADPMFCDFCNP